MGKKSIRRLESKGKRKFKSKLTKTLKSQIKVIVTEILRKATKSKSKEKGLGICFHIFTKVVYRIAI